MSTSDRAGVLGAARLVIEELYSPDAVNRALAGRAAGLVDEVARS